MCPLATTCSQGGAHGYLNHQQTSGGAAAARQSAAQQIGVAARLHGGKTTRRIKWAGVR
jgi:hypothetical protein